MPGTDLLTSFTAWADGRPGLEPDVAETIVDLKANYLADRQPGRWRPGDLESVLLDLVPRKVSADDEWYASVVPTTRAYLRFASEQGLLHRGSAPLPVLLAELDGIAGEFDEAVHDPARAGMAKSILGAMSGGDLSSLASKGPAELQRMMDEFNARPSDERKGLTDPWLTGRIPDDELDDDAFDDDEDDEPPPLPAVRLAPPAELATAARASTLLHQLDRLVQWAEPGRRVTEDGTLTSDEVAPAAAELGADAGGERLSLAQVHTLWDVAVLADLVELGDDVARPGTAAGRLAALREAEPGADERLLALWARAMAIVAGQETLAPPEDGEVEAAADSAVEHLLFATYSGDAHTLEELLDEVRAAEVEQPGDADEALVAAVGTRLRAVVGGLERLGAVRPLHVDAPGGLIELTPLGMFGVREYALEQGIEAPLVADVTGLDAHAFLRAVREAAPDLVDGLVEEWLAARGRDRGVDELVELARSGPAGARQAALTLLQSALGGDGFERLATSVSREPVLGPVTRAFVAMHDVTPQLFEAAQRALGPDATPMTLADRLVEPAGCGDPEEIAAVADALGGFAWLHADLAPADRDVMTVESIAGWLEDVEPPVRNDDLPPSVWTLLDEVTVTRLGTVAHPELLVVLDAVGTGHPVGRVRKAAKKAAHKARRASAGPIGMNR